MRELLIRSISGLVYVAILSAAALEGIVPVALLLMFFMVIGSLELLKLTSSGMPRLYRNTLTILMTLFFNFIPVIIATSEYYLLNPIPFFVNTLAFIAVLFFLIIRNLVKNDFPLASLVNGAGSILIYLILPFVCMIMLSENMNRFGLPALLILFIIIWANDTFAYLVGTAIGENRILEKISPKKSWEGLIGGIILSLALLCALMEMSILSWSPGLLISAFFVVVAGTLGDFLESKLKRDAGVKDSGKIMPGHGGILDRIDSLLLAAPVFLVCTIIIQAFESSLL